MSLDNVPDVLSNSVPDPKSSIFFDDVPVAYLDRIPGSSSEVDANICHLIDELRLDMTPLPDDSESTRESLRVLKNIAAYIESEGFLLEPPRLRAGILCHLVRACDKAIQIIMEERKKKKKKLLRYLCILNV